MSSTTEPASTTRSEKYYLEDGDVIVKVETILFRFHSYHLSRTTTYFDKLLETTTPAGWYSTESADADACPIDIEDSVCACDFEALLWFFYESAYQWVPQLNSVTNATWESVLLLSEKFSMPAVALAACLALCRCGADLGDVRKIAICHRNNLASSWYEKELKAIVTRDECLSADEARQLGFELTTAIARAREEVANARRDREPCSGPLECPTRVSEMQCCLGTHICLSSFTHSVLCSQSPNVESALAAIDVDSTLSRESLKNVAHFRSNSMGANQGDVYLKVEDAIICLHSHHLNRATHVFRNQLSAPINPGYAQEGASPSCPLLLPDDKEIIWKDLLWFFYDSQYQRSLVCNVGGLARWRSVLELGTKYEMKDVCMVAVLALDSANTLTPIQKIRLYDQHQLDSSLAEDTVRTICLRSESLTRQEAEELGYARTMEIAKLREDIVRTQLDLARAELEAARRKLRRQARKAIEK